MAKVKRRELGRGSWERACLGQVGGTSNKLLLWLLLLDLLEVRLLCLFASSTTTATSASLSSASRTLLLLLLESRFVGSLLHGADFLRLLLVLGLLPLQSFLFPGDHHGPPHLLNFLDVTQLVHLAVLLG